MSFSNVTSPFYQSSEALYTGTDFSQLSWFEKQWAAWYIWIGNPVIATGLASFIMHEVVYFGRCIPWIIVDAIPYFRRWKLQPNKIPTKGEQWECTKQVLFSHFAVEAPLIWMFHPICELFGLATWQVPFPSWQTQLPQLAFFFVFEDMFHYFAHQALHTGRLYKMIHKIHHKYSAPFGLAAEYAHPAEVGILGAGTIAGPFLWCWFRRDLHIITMYIWIVLRLFQAIDAHSGYDFPWSLQHIIPFWSGADHHDFHHMAFVNNYSTSFRWWDFMLGTDTKYHAYKKRMAAAKAAAKDEAAKQALEQKINDETEQDGLAAERVVESSVKTTKVI
jgi:methylsterol monooxygenase